MSSGCARMYDRNDDNFQRPRVWIIESGIPAQAAVVAVPMLKL